MRSVTELSKKGAWVYLANETVAKKFLSDAEAEGFTYIDGTKPTDKSWQNLYAIHKDWTINTVGWAGHLAFKNCKMIRGEELVKVDYEKYVLGEDEYVIRLLQ